ELSPVAGREFIRYTPEEVRKFLAGEAPLGSDRDHNTTPARKPKSDDFLYTGPVAEMPNLGPDDLDEHGAPVGEETSPGPDRDEDTPAPKPLENRSADRETETKPPSLTELFDESASRASTGNFFWDTELRARLVLRSVGSARYLRDAYTQPRLIVW